MHPTHNILLILSLSLSLLPSLQIATHVISSIVHIAHKYDNDSNPWPIQIEDHFGNLHSVNLEPGQVDRKSHSDIGCCYETFLHTKSCRTWYEWKGEKTYDENFTKILWTFFNFLLVCLKRLQVFFWSSVNQEIYTLSTQSWPKFV